MAYPTAQPGLGTSDSDSASEAASRADSGHLVSVRKQWQNLRNRLSTESKHESTEKARGQVKPPSNAEAGKRGQSQYAQFLHRSSVGPPADQVDSQPLLRRSSSLGAPGNRDDGPADAPPSSAAGGDSRRLRNPAPAWEPAAAATDAGLNAPKMERQHSRVYSVAAHQSADGDCDSADHVQEVASHREQMTGVARSQAEGAAGDASQPQARPQLERKSFERQLTFQEMLRQQIQVRFSAVLLRHLLACSKKFYRTAVTCDWFSRLAPSVEVRIEVFFSFLFVVTSCLQASPPLCARLCIKAYCSSTIHLQQPGQGFACSSAPHFWVSSLPPYWVKKCPVG